MPNESPPNPPPVIGTVHDEVTISVDELQNYQQEFMRILNASAVEASNRWRSMYNGSWVTADYSRIEERVLASPLPEPPPQVSVGVDVGRTGRRQSATYSNYIQQDARLSLAEYARNRLSWDIETTSLQPLPIRQSGEPMYDIVVTTQNARDPMYAYDTCQGDIVVATTGTWIGDVMLNVGNSQLLNLSKLGGQLIQSHSYFQVRKLAPSEAITLIVRS